jgi:MtaA/CmuA family methyltransferase
MTGRERVFAFLKKQPVDRIPNLSINKAAAARLSNTPYGLYCTDYRRLVTSYLGCCERFGIDTTNVMSDPLREAADFGAAIRYSDDRLPILLEPLIQEQEDIRKLKPYNPYEARRAVNTCNGIRLFRQLAGERLVICGIIEMPFAEAATLRGVQNIMLDLYDDPDFVIEMMEIILETMKKYIRAQKEAGADLMWFGDAAASLVSPELYARYILPYEQRMIRQAKEEGMITRLHICGNTNHLLGLMDQSGADIIDLDWMVDLQQALSLFSDQTFISGNLDPVALYLEGTPAMIRDKVFELASLNCRTLIISSGCEIPRNSPDVNIEAHVRALEDFAATKRAH